ncbi:HK97-gp10 family putative phage morphogenesis protein [Micromonospora sp. NPDC049366]|uniref:HK97-gp10 family putative phage morphogenesis protein n=1 Tax=Micromonospora sp. NPDC049366 TaxID=3364271 RepID=UPI003797A632
MASVWVEGIDEMNTIAEELRVKNHRIGRQGAAVVKASAYQVEALAKLFAPVRTGHLKSTIGPPDFTLHMGGGVLEAAISATARYAVYVEWGTRNMAPRAFMGPALDRVGPQFAAAVAAISDPFDGGMVGVRGGG